MVLGQWVTWNWPADPHNWKFQHCDSLLQMFRRWMQNNVFPREDYRELLELTVTYLGGQVYLIMVIFYRKLPKNKYYILPYFISPI
jgi:hypothetical protein